MTDPPQDPPADSPDSAVECPKVSRNASNKARNMSCPEILAKINELMNTEKRGRMGTKGLIQRFRDYLSDDSTHGPTIEDQQASLRSYLDAYKNKGCGDPPPGAQELADRKLPTRPLPQGSQAADAAKTAAVAGGAVVAGYWAYRAIRMIPSLLPPLWETIPLNAVVP